jgi:hypothetical protein
MKFRVGSKVIVTSTYNDKMLVGCWGIIEELPTTHNYYGVRLDNEDELSSFLEEELDFF